MTNIEELKNRAVREVEQLKSELFQVSDWLYEHPELGSEEYRAVEYLTTYLGRKGFQVSGGTAKIPTAFVASRGEGPPRIAFLAEYDALPNIGHGCEHNMIAASAVGSAVAVSKLLDQIKGTVIVIGTPDEEARGKYGGSKILLARAEVFREIDAVLMMHGAVRYSVGGPALAVKDLMIEFKGKTSHAAASPEEGVQRIGCCHIDLCCGQHVKTTCP